MYIAEVTGNGNCFYESVKTACSDQNDLYDYAPFRTTRSIRELVADTFLMPEMQESLTHIHQRFIDREIDEEVPVFQVAREIMTRSDRAFDVHNIEQWYELLKRSLLVDRTWASQVEYEAVKFYMMYHFMMPLIVITPVQRATTMDDARRAREEHGERAIILVLRDFHYRPVMKGLEEPFSP